MGADTIAQGKVSPRHADCVTPDHPAIAVTAMRIARCSSFPGSASESASRFGEALGDDEPRGGLDEGEVREGLREVAEVAGGLRVVLLREQPERRGRRYDALHEGARRLRLTHDRERRHEPEGADHEAALLAGEPVVDSALGEISSAVKIGRTALLAVVDEPSPEIVDTAMAEAGGTVIRRAVADVEAEIAAAEDAERKAKWEARKELMRGRREHDSAAVQAKMSELKGRLRHERERPAEAGGAPAAARGPAS